MTTVLAIMALALCANHETQAPAPADSEVRGPAADWVGPLPKAVTAASAPVTLADGSLLCINELAPQWGQLVLIRADAERPGSVRSEVVAPEMAVLAPHGLAVRADGKAILCLAAVPGWHTTLSVYEIELAPKVKATRLNGVLGDERHVAAAYVGGTADVIVGVETKSKDWEVWVTQADRTRKLRLATGGPSEYVSSVAWDEPGGRGVFVLSSTAVMRPPNKHDQLPGALSVGAEGAEMQLVVGGCSMIVVDKDKRLWVVDWYAGASARFPDRALRLDTGKRGADAKIELPKQLLRFGRLYSAPTGGVLVECEGGVAHATAERARASFVEIKDLRTGTVLLGPAPTLRRIRDGQTIEAFAYPADPPRP